MRRVKYLHCKLASLGENVSFFVISNRELSNLSRDPCGNDCKELPKKSWRRELQDLHKLTYLTKISLPFAGFARAFFVSRLYILSTLSSNQRLEMTCVEAVWWTGFHNIVIYIFFCFVPFSPNCLYQFHPSITLTKREMVFRYCSHFRRRCPFFNDQSALRFVPVYSPPSLSTIFISRIERRGPWKGKFLEQWTFIFLYCVKRCDN